jgi:hypothetical protein
MSTKPKIQTKTPIKNMSADALDKDLSRCKRALGNKNLMPQSIMYYSRRQEMIEAELERRS